MDRGPLYVAGVAALGWWSPAGLAVLVGLTVLVLVHESGHLVAARRCGIAASEYFAGFGPVVVARTADGLRVGLKAIPAGGYVKVVGMSSAEHVQPDEEATTYWAASRLRRLAVVAAGPVVNVAFGFMLLFGAAAMGERPRTPAPPSTPGTAACSSPPPRSKGSAHCSATSTATAPRSPTRRSRRGTHPLPVAGGVAQLSTDLAADGPLTVDPAHGHRLDRPRRDERPAAAAARRGPRRRGRRRIGAGPGPPRPSLRLDTSNRVVAAVTAVTFALVLTLGASAILFDLASPVRL